MNAHRIPQNTFSELLHVVHPLPAIRGILLSLIKTLIRGTKKKRNRQKNT